MFDMVMIEPYIYNYIAKAYIYMRCKKVILAANLCQTFISAGFLKWKLVLLGFEASII